MKLLLRRVQFGMCVIIQLFLFSLIFQTIWEKNISETLKSDMLKLCECFLVWNDFPQFLCTIKNF